VTDAENEGIDFDMRWHPEDLGWTAKPDAERKPDLLPFEWAGDVQPVLDGLWLIDGWLPRSGIGLIYGHPGSGKTFLALDMAEHVATGAPWAGRHVERGLVLYLAAEGQLGFRNRLSAMRNEGGLPVDAPFAFVPVPIDLQAPDGDTGRLSATLHHVAKWAGKTPALVIIDTLSKTFGLGKENTDDMAGYIANCQRIASEFGCFTLILHHRPKETESREPRGHSSLRGGIDTAILVEGSGTTKTATTIKQKDGEDNQKVMFTLEQVALGFDKKGKEVSTCLVAISEDTITQSEMSPIEAKKHRLKGKKKTALRTIEILIEKDGKLLPDGIPGDLINRWKTFKAIEADKVADRLENEFLATADNYADKKEASAKREVRRALKELKDAEIVGSWGNWLWLN
jgi:RecA-family ATPase